MVTAATLILYSFDANIERNGYIIEFTELAADSHAIFVAHTEEVNNTAVTAQQALYGSRVTAANRSDKLSCCLSVFQLLENIA